VYTAGDTSSAIPVFEQALALVPDYANAKYFLGLSYEAGGQHEKALQLFRDLRAANTDNEEVRMIVQNLEQGKPPFEGAAATPPEERAAAPVSQ
jgi:tetratricopeptide (TPR) repeat protein